MKALGIASALVIAALFFAVTTASAWSNVGLGGVGISIGGGGSSSGSVGAGGSSSSGGSVESGESEEGEDEGAEEEGCFETCHQEYEDCLSGCDDRDERKDCAHYEDKCRDDCRKFEEHEDD